MVKKIIQVASRSLPIGGRTPLKKIYSSFFPNSSDEWFKVAGIDGRPDTLFGSPVHLEDRSIMPRIYGTPQWMGYFLETDSSTNPSNLTDGIVNDDDLSKYNQNNVIDLPPKLLIKCSLNNIFLELSGEKGRPIYAISAGCLGFKNAQKTTNKTALAMMDALWLKFSQLSINRIRVDFRGVNPARQILLAQLRRPGLEITEIMDTTPKPFNGPRAKKIRRI